MNGSATSPLLQLILRASGDQCRDDRPDHELLRRFCTERDEGAFHHLVRRHGAMVLDVCRSVLGNEEDAEDAFQATFLVLARRGGAIRKPGSIGSWLHGVAYRTALKAQAGGAKRKRHEARAPGKTPSPAPDDLTWREVRQVIHAELNGLAERYRAPLVLCYLTGKTRDEAAALLGVSKARLKKDLERGRGLLRGRLVRRGLGCVAGLLAGVGLPAASAAVPSALLDATARAATLIAGGSLTASAISGNVASLTQGVLNDMFRTKLIVIAALLAGIGLVVGGAAALTRPGSAGQPAAGQPPKPAAKQAESKTPETADQRATRLALGVTAKAVAINNLPRFSYQSRSRWGGVDSLRAVDGTLEQFKEGLTAPVLGKDWFGWYERGMSWDEKRMIEEIRPGEADLAYDFRFWTADEGWCRHEDKAKTSRQFVRSHSGRTPGDRGFYYSYLRHLTAAPHWPPGRTPGLAWGTKRAPADMTTWKHLGTEKFGGEACDVVEGDKGIRLWIGQKSGHVRGILACLNHAEPNELALLDDYREVSPGVWLPFREVRTFQWHSETQKGKRRIMRSELVVTEARADRDLAGRYAQLLPGEGDTVQDQRFKVPVNLRHSARRTDDEIRKQAEADYQEQLKGQEEVKRLIQPVADLVGKPAPALPAEGWLGGKRPDVAGKPYLLHFWATWCGPCKGDLPQLKALAERGVIVIGMHPAGTPAADVEKVIGEQKLGYPTFLEQGLVPLVTKQRSTGTSPVVAKKPTIAGYPAAVFPYCIVVDAQGRVAGHGSLADVMGLLGR